MLTPKQIVEALDKYIIGQDDAKRTVAIALRNRYRRSRLSDELKEEVIPKNIIMIGPTGVGKTEIARRLAKLVDAPFVKVEATKFTEVGYVGRDVDSMIRDLVEASIRLVKGKWQEKVRTAASAAAEKRLVDILCADHSAKAEEQTDQLSNLQKLFGMLSTPKTTDVAPVSDEEAHRRASKRSDVLRDLQDGKLEDKIVEIEVTESNTGNDQMLAMGIDINMNEMFGGLLPKKTKIRKTTVKEARRILENEEADKLIDMDAVIDEAVEKAEQDGIVFIDEIDKIAASGTGHGPDVSREGVQRDILPIVEGSVVNTKYGPVKTNYMLFIAAGAFHVSKVNDLIPELQGRFPITVTLNALTLEDYKRILTAPENALIKQYTALLETDNIHIEFTEDALTEVATACFNANETGENIGARRLHTIVENLLEDISFNATGDYPMLTVRIDKNYVNDHISGKKNENLDKYII
ncbi:MAG: ATP-dependent protease ATPase subunit HslU [Clostridia bacterium]|nr:ATP-dependent protease ATPase subunit HslU [Clostridia bacterium]